MASSTSSMYECPVCAEEFADPKILPCAHRICRKCIMSWIMKGGGQNTCPLCRAPVIPPTQPGQSDLATLVDALPTDLAIVTFVESQAVLRGPHVCSICDDEVVAMSFCMQCDIKLCKTCVKGHKKIPATRNHVTMELNKLTAHRLAEVNRTTCKTHPDRTSELYCPVHQEVICILCGTTSHGNCADKKTVKEAAAGKRSELSEQAHRLRELATEISKQIRETKDGFLAVRIQAKDTFDDLQQCLEKRRQEAFKQIQVREDASVTSLRELERLETALISNAASMENLVNSAPEGAFLSILKTLAARFDRLETQSETTDRIKVANFSFDPLGLDQLKTDIAALGEIVTPEPTETGVTPPTQRGTPGTPPTHTGTPGTPPTQRGTPETPPTQRGTPVTTFKPRRRALARVLKVGDRVKRGPDWSCGNQDKGGPGTVTAIPSRILAVMGGDPQGRVDVRWDHGAEHWYYMGAFSLYHLDLL